MLMMLKDMAARFRDKPEETAWDVVGGIVLGSVLYALVTLLPLVEPLLKHGG